ncbi:MAG: sensor histidine kinase [Myxococcota bacterium]
MTREFVAPTPRLVERTWRWLWLGWASAAGLSALGYAALAPSVWGGAAVGVWAIAFAAWLTAVRQGRGSAHDFAALAGLGLLATSTMVWAKTPLQTTPVIMMVIVTALVLRFSRALMLSVLFSVLGAVAVFWSLEDPSAVYVRFMVPVVLPFAFGLILRKSLLETLRAEDMAAELVRVNETLQVALHAADELAVARERARMARELHDSLGHRLTIGAVQLEAAQSLLSSRAQGRAREALATAQLSVQTGLEELRSCVSVLREDTAEVALSQALEELARAAHRASCVVEFEVLGRERRLDTMREFACFRAFQEALTNATKHAQATRISATLDYQADRVELRVLDDGVGCADVVEGQGLRGLRDRVEVLGGAMLAAGRPGQGFAVTFSMPLFAKDDVSV